MPGPGIEVVFVEPRDAEKFMESRAVMGEVYVGYRVGGKVVVLLGSLTEDYRYLIGTVVTVEEFERWRKKLPVMLAHTYIGEGPMARVVEAARRAGLL